MMRATRGALAALAAAALLGACSEDLTGGAACPSLCPQQGLALKDTTIESALSLDTTLVGYPPVGTEGALYLSRRGDTLETAAAIRFDTVLSQITRASTGTVATIESIDTASLQLGVFEKPILKTGAVTLKLYDIDTSAADRDTAAVRTLFRDDRLLLTRVIPADSVALLVTDTLGIPVPAAFLLPRVLGGKPVRLGVRISADSSIALRAYARTATVNGSVLRYRGRIGTDTATLVIRTNARGLVSTDVGAADLADVTILLKGPPLPVSSALTVGGFPASRSYLRFTLPEDLVKSATIVRASLLLTQRPSTAIDATDSITVGARLVRAGRLLDPDPGKAALLLLDAAASVTPSVRLMPGDSGLKLIEIAPYLRAWASEDSANVPRAIVLQAGDEAFAPHSVIFFSTEAANPALRPKLRITYVPNSRFGLP